MSFTFAGACEVLGIDPRQSRVVARSVATGHTRVVLPDNYIGLAAAVQNGTWTTRHCKPHGSDAELDAARAWASVNH